MAHRFDVASTLAFIERHGYSLLFFWVLAEQSAVPLPSVPLLVAAGALIRAGRLSLAPALACCVAAALIGDTIWFELGRRRGRRILRVLCRISLEPDSCVRQTENAFLKYGLKALLISKFIPGLNTVAAPMAGSSRTAYGRFLLFNGSGAAIWSGAYMAVGYIFSDQLEDVIDSVSRMGSNLLLLVVGLLASWLGWKFLQRRRFLKHLETIRITPEELQGRLDAGEELFIVDLRNALPEEQDLIPGALHITPENLYARSTTIPRDRDIILFCS